VMVVTAVDSSWLLLLPDVEGELLDSRSNIWHTGFKIQLLLFGEGVVQLKAWTSQGGLLYHILATLDDYPFSFVFLFSPHSSSFFFLLNVQSQRDTLRQLTWKSPLVRGAKLGPFLQKRAGLRGENFGGCKSSKNIERRMCCFACKKKKKVSVFQLFVFVCTNVLPSRKCWWNENDLLNCLRDP
jgi:hypothetical protein